MKCRAKLRFSMLSFLLLLFAASPVFGDNGGKRLALIVGMSNYAIAGSLPNATRDAEAFSGFLQSKGFEADLVLNADRKSFAEALSRFARKIGPQDIALFYFAGHGMQLHGENFLIGTDARLESEFDVPAETVALSEIINALEKRARISLVFLDACRNNPLANKLNVDVDGATRGGATRGLAPIETQGAGTLVAFAAAPGQVAADGTDGHSPFTRALIANLSGPGLEVGTAFKRVVRDVRKDTGGKQSPQILSSLSLEFYFGPETPTAASTQTAPSTAVDPAELEAEADFKKALRVGTPRIWRFFVAKHRTGEYAELGRQALAQIDPATARGQNSTPQTIESRLLPSKEARRSVQLALAATGLEIGTADGVFGEQTRAAIRQYQSRNQQPSNGFISERTAKALGIAVSQDIDGVYSATKAREYKIDDLRGLETDGRVLRAVECLPRYDTVYGAFQGHLYVVVRYLYVPASVAQYWAKSCGAHLATITSDAENEFVASLFNSDENFFNTGYDPNGGVSYKMGPWIGLVQASQGREPRGGWGWDDGEPLTYSKWFANMPNEHKKGDDVGMYYAHREGRADLKSLRVTTWDDMGPQDATGSFLLEFE